MPVLIGALGTATEKFVQCIKQIGVPPNIIFQKTAPPWNNIYRGVVRTLANN